MLINTHVKLLYFYLILERCSLPPGNIDSYMSMEELKFYLFVVTVLLLGFINILYPFVSLYYLRRWKSSQYYHWNLNLLTMLIISVICNQLISAFALIFYPIFDLHQWLLFKYSVSSYVFSSLFFSASDMHHQIVHPNFSIFVIRLQYSFLLFIFFLCILDIVK